MSNEHRLYVGNLPYIAQKADVEALFARNDIDIKGVDISIDPHMGRNPSYCFVDFHTDEDAERSLKIIEGQKVRGRPVKCRPHVPATGKRKRTEHERGHAFDRWARAEEAPAHWIAPQAEGRQLYVSGLPRMDDQDETNRTMRELLRDFEVQAVSKLIRHDNPKSGKSEPHRYCFVDLATADAARKAAEALDGSTGPHGGEYRVRLSLGKDVRQDRPTKVMREQFRGVHSEAMAKAKHGIVLPENTDNRIHLDY